MLALRKTAPARGLSLAEVAPPEPAPGEVIVRVAAAGICGSDLHVDDWTSSYGFIAPALPVTLGHEVSGYVAALGDGVSALRPGQAVVVMPSVTCGVCAHCRDDLADHCETRTGIGMTRDGGFAPLVAVPARNCLPVPPTLSPDLAALTEPLTVARQAVDRGAIGDGDRVLVLGPGTIGQAIALMARLAGAAEIVVCGHGDVNRLATVEALGFERTLDLADAGADAALRRHAGAGFDVVFEATGNPAAIDTGIAQLRRGGALVAAGIHEAPAPLDVTALVRRQIDIRGAYRAPLATWPAVIDMLIASPAAFAPMITHRMPLSEGLEAFSMAHRREGSKVLLVPEG
jgi:2-desacetyl-2-hydroxyethyl bacteriochlorophyllide A dehydrogenase